MAIGAYTGLPGSGKSYGVFENVIVPALKKGKLLYTNIPFNDEAVAAYCGKVPIFFHIDDIRKNPNWFQEVFQSGAVLVIDEVWRLWPSGMKANAIPEQHKSFLAEHRHMVGEDGYSTEIFLVTQDLSQLAMFARDLVETTYRANKLTAIGSSKKFRVDIYDGPVKGPKPPADKRLRQIFGQYKPEIYSLYKSHTMSETGAAGDETPTDKRKNIFLGAAFKAIIFVIIGGGVVVYLGYKSVTGFYRSGGKVDGEVASVAQPAQVKAATPAPREVGFLHGMNIHIVWNQVVDGKVDYVYKITKGDFYSTVGEFELRFMKYDVQPVNQCLVVIVGYGERFMAQCYREPEKEGLNLVAGTASAL